MSAMGEHYYISAGDLPAFMGGLTQHHSVYAPVKKGNQRFYQRVEDPAADWVIGEVRCFEPLKAFFFRAREKVAEDFSPDVISGGEKPCCIVGAKACDLKGFKVGDFVFGNPDDPDPYYTRPRAETLIISADCTEPLDTCFCLSLDVTPYPQDGFDLNLSEVDDGYIVDVGSERGAELVKANATLMQEAGEAQLARRESRRSQVRKELNAALETGGVPDQSRFKGIIEKAYDGEIWQEEAEACVECGACNTICPTCHCFLLYDQQDEESMTRLKVWDSCMIKDFARVAGGGNPRPMLWMRLRNRFEKKFDFFPKVADLYACTGCGRCIPACPAKIDIRNVLRKLVDHAESR